MEHEVNVPSGYHLVLLNSIGSTNDELKKLAISENVSEGRVLWALEQTAGKGRNGREWISNLGNIYLSVLFRPKCSSYIAAQIGFLPAIAALMSIDAMVGRSLEIRFKWPNDLLLNLKKVGGTLIETRSGKDGTVDWVVAGFGLNLTNHPEQTTFPATCLRLEVNKSIQINKMVELYLFNLAKLYNIWQKNGFDPIRKKWLASAHGLNEIINVRLGSNYISGIFRDLDEDGSMVLETGSRLTKITAGEVYYIEGN